MRDTIITRCSFNPRPPAEGDTSLSLSTVQNKGFQSTPSCGGRLHNSSPFPRWGCFNPRPPAEGDLQVSTTTPWPCCFNPRPPAEGDHVGDNSSYLNGQFQSTPSCGGRRAMRTNRFRRFFVSIHALLRRATNMGYLIPIQVTVSIHALLRRATRSLRRHAQKPACFNPRPPAEGDWDTPIDLALFWEFQSTPSCGGRPERAANHI